MSKRKLSQEEIRILARTECLILWEELAKTGSDIKGPVILDLYRKGELCRKWYEVSCPFCEYFIYDDGYRCGYHMNCEICIWPGEGESRCCDGISAFTKWDTSINKKDRKKYAKEMVKFILSIDI